MPFLSATILLLLMPICCLAPGFFFIRRLRWSGTEKVCASIGLSLIMIYLAATLIYFSGLNWKWCWLVTGGWIAMIVKSWPDLKPFLLRWTVRRQLGAFAALVALGVLLLGLILHYSGGKWAGDWTEHYERTLFFLNHLPHDTIFIKLYILPARPPMMHLIASYFLGHVGGSFDLFQIVSFFLNALAFFPCVLLAGQFTRQGLRRVWLVMALLATSPVFLQNVTWTWNKQFAAFYILMSIGFYLRAWRMRSQARMIAAGLSMAGAVLVHYSAGPYAVFMLAHYLWIFFRERRRPAEFLKSAAATLVLLMTWFGWSIAIYGTSQTFKSNTTVAGSEKMTIRETIGSISSNLFYTLVPHPLRWSPTKYSVGFEQPNAFGYVRDYFFNLYQPNFLCGFGLIAWAFVFYLMLRALKPTNWSTICFWGMLVLFIVPVGIAANSTTEIEGVAHVCLQPLILIGRTLLAVSFLSLRRWLRITLAASFVIDVVLGIILHFRMEMNAFWVYYVDKWPIFPFSRGMLNPQAVVNSGYRFFNSYTYFADHFLAVNRLMLLAVMVFFGWILFALANAAVTGRPVMRQNRTRFAVLAVSIYAFGATLSVCDRLFGYKVNNAFSVPRHPSQELVNNAINPLMGNVSAGSDSADAYYELAATAYRFAQMELAFRSVQAALLLDPDHRKAHFLLGMLQVANHLTLTPEMPAYSAFYQMYRDDKESYARYAVYLYTLGFKLKAMEVLTEIVAQYPDYPVAQENLAIALYQSGQIPQGIEHGEIALRQSPGADEYADRLRSMLAARGDTGPAIEKRIREIQQGK